MATGTLRVGLVQQRAHPLDVTANVEQARAAIADAAARGADLVVLPELFTSGYVLDRQRLLHLAETPDAPGIALGSLAAVAREHGVIVVAGFPELAKDRLYNSAVVLDTTGTAVGVYRKLHLFGPERQVFDPGDRGLPIFEVGGTRLGMLVCYDLRFPEALRILAIQGAELVAVPTAWVAGYDRHVPGHGFIGQVRGALVQANLNQVFVACADQVGDVEGVRLLGRSLVCDPYGEPRVGPLSADEPDLVVTEVDLTEVERARHRALGVDPLANRRTDVYGELLGYTATPELEPVRRDP